MKPINRILRRPKEAPLMSLKNSLISNYEFNTSDSSIYEGVPVRTKTFKTHIPITFVGKEVVNDKTSIF